MEAKKLLVVDDNQLLRRLVKIYLCKCGYSVELCEGPFGIMNKVREFSPHVVLMDLNMPGLNGHKLAELLGGLRGSSGCKLLVFSSEDEEIQAELVKKGVADGYFLKSHSLNGLEEKIEEVLGNMEQCCSSGLHLCNIECGLDWHRVEEDRDEESACR